MDIVNILKNGGIVVIPTDTIYGIVGSALNPQTVEEIYRLRKRAANKPFIILISNLNDLNHFNISLTEKQVKFLNKVWPNPVSVALPCSSEKFAYLHRGTNSLAFRIPNDEKLLEVLKQTGPLVAPSANFEGEEPSQNIKMAKIYFSNEIDFYVDGGAILSKPSMLVAIIGDSVKILREGDLSLSAKIKQVVQKLGFEFDQT